TRLPSIRSHPGGAIFLLMIPSSELRTAASTDAAGTPSAEATRQLIHSAQSSPWRSPDDVQEGCLNSHRVSLGSSTHSLGTLPSNSASEAGHAEMSTTVDGSFTSPP